jgi:RNA recognition motif-containing protein
VSSSDDFRLFCGDLGNEVTDEMLKKAFSKFPSFAMAKVVRNKRNQKTRGYGFVSFLDPNDYAEAFREFNGRLRPVSRLPDLGSFLSTDTGKYLGNRPLKLRKSKWKDRNK